MRFRRVKFIALLSVGVLALSGCRIWTVLDHEDIGNPYFFYAQDVDALPAGGFVAVSCDWDGVVWDGVGVVIARSDEDPQWFGDCDGPMDASRAADGWIYYSDNDYGDPYGEPPVPSEFGISRVDPETGTRQVVFTFDRQIDSPTIAPDGRLLFGAQDAVADEDGTYHYRIHEVTGSASSLPVPGTEDLGRSDFVVDAGGAIVAASGVSHQVFSVTPDGARTLVAGTGVRGYSGDSGPATSAQLSEPLGVDVTPSGAVLIADFGNSRVRRIATDGTISTVAGGGYSRQEGTLATVALIAPLAVAAVNEVDFYIADGADEREIRYVGFSPPG